MAAERALDVAELGIDEGVRREVDAGNMIGNAVDDALDLNAGRRRFVDDSSMSFDAVCCEFCPRT